MDHLHEVPQIQHRLRCGHCLDVRFLKKVGLLENPRLRLPLWIATPNPKEEPVSLYIRHLKSACPTIRSLGGYYHKRPGQKMSNAFNGYLLLSHSFEEC